MWFIGGGGRVYIDCWRELDIIGEPAPTGLLTLVQNISLYLPIAVLKKVRYALCPMPYALCPVVPHLSEKGYTYYKPNLFFLSQIPQLFHNPT
jgi:hypothetical protein